MKSVLKCFFFKYFFILLTSSFIFSLSLKNVIIFDKPFARKRNIDKLIKIHHTCYQFICLYANDDYTTFCSLIVLNWLLRPTRTSRKLAVINLTSDSNIKLHQMRCPLLSVRYIINNLYSKDSKINLSIFNIEDNCLSFIVKLSKIIKTIFLFTLLSIISKHNWNIK